jgi:tRNA threonylcarbamoyladenosine modification (KEOPS) complex Cgi121 subunit
LTQATDWARAYNKFFAIAGFKNVKIKDVNRFLEGFQRKVSQVHIQFFDARRIASRQHLYFSALNALKAFERKVNISNTIVIESLLYASAQRQIRKAVDKIGIKETSSNIALLVITENEKETCQTLETITKMIPGERDDAVLQLTDEKIVEIRNLFGISDLEIAAKTKRKDLEKEALIELVIEHIALLATQR